MNCRKIEYNGKIYSLKELAEVKNLTPAALTYRLKKVNNDVKKIDDFITRKKITDEMFKKRAKELDLTVFGTYRSGKHRLDFKCDLCGFEFNVVAENVWIGNSCKKCKSKKKKKTKEEFQEEIKDRGLIVQGKYVTNQIPIKILCTFCNWVDYYKPVKITGGNGCKNCGNGNMKNQKKVGIGRWHLKK